jgi:hypothetical protein
MFRIYFRWLTGVGQLFYTDLTADSVEDAIKAFSREFAFARRENIVALS